MSAGKIMRLKLRGRQFDAGLLGRDAVLDDEPRLDLSESHHHEIDEAHRGARDPRLQPQADVLEGEQEDDQQDDPADDDGTEPNLAHGKKQCHDFSLGSRRTFNWLSSTSTTAI